MASHEEYLSIPQPPLKWFFGNIQDIDPVNTVGSFWRLADIYGPIFKLSLPGRTVIVVSSYELVNDVCDWNRFEKPVNGALKEVRALTGDGLFTAYPGEHNWGVAHRLLMPVFGPMGIRKMFGGMVDIASQMLLRWDRFGPDHEILCSDDFTRLTFDMIGLCAFGFRFNNFYTDEAHPFVTQMTDVLIESGRRANRLDIENRLRIFSAKTNQENVAAMHKLCDEIIADRQAHPQPELNDLLNPMLNGKDPETGEKMTLENVRFNMVTFLVAGHETTSGTLGFLFYHLLKNPDKYMAAQKEVDDVLGDAPLEMKHLSQLKYVKYCIYEALRFLGPISLIAKHAKHATKLAGKYDITPEEHILCNLRPFHHDPKIWGEDAEEYKPERFLNGGYEALPPNAFKAFGDGPRACIGRGFAEQEMVMVVALILQKFQVEMADPRYQFHVKVSLTLKPADFKIKVRRRLGRDLSTIGGPFTAPAQSQSAKGAAPNEAPKEQRKGITILYGSQAGTCKSYAEELEGNAPRFGLKAKVETLDSATEAVPKDQPVIIIASSYEGKPADNAKKFVQWLECNSSSKILEGVNYAIFSVGNSDWANTFHRVPKLIDELFEKMGAQRLTKTGFVDVKYDIMGPWEDWTEVMWKDLRSSSGTIAEIIGGKLRAEITPPKFATHLGGADIGYGIVKGNKDLGGSDVGLSKKHLEIELPEGVGYRSGDYLVVLPLNPLNTTKRVLRRFDISPDDSITVTGTNKAFLSPDEPISVFDLISTRVELGTPASQKQIQVLAEATPEEKRAKLLELVKDEIYKKDVLSKRFSVLDLLEDNPSTRLPFATYLDMLKPLTPRQYSISSSPLANVDFVRKPDGRSVQKLIASVTYDVHREGAWSGHGQFLGVASTYLALQEPGDKVRCFTRPTNANFHLPLDPMTPIIMAAAGTGIAPMRGFIQERAIIKQARNQALGPAILYFGCRHYEKDFIYSDELSKWEAEGIVSVRPCFSKAGPEGHQKYVPDRMWEDREELAKLFGEAGAKIFVCGSASKLAKSTAEVCKKIWREKTGGNEQAALEWLDRVKENRYVSDVFE
ncbi:bifunctional P-450/NADPH-P450 reductase [Lindgomyces ingoldianus]|uniref:Bifunctional P-450/NADPH-P450 reductase n=1 Tax=Lindgomyces ingoldianus TaxID=673940 RepID=A0ACB6QUH6_9PLEO|nr:bifunctional P-450/NADPH-P450 reductase [Lindgomyces ingoldianus]KAF2470639.1 bifunctional P-450/NADPH-P450 reductase [Lindgomyces ingoldianus]